MGWVDIFDGSFPQWANSDCDLERGKESIGILIEEIRIAGLQIPGKVSQSLEISDEASREQGVYSLERVSLYTEHPLQSHFSVIKAYE